MKDQFSSSTIWHQFVHDMNINTQQAALFMAYAQLLQSWNQKINLTGYNDLDDIITYHFYDSLMATRYVNFSSVQTIADIGTGAGFPGIPIALCHPHLSVILIEVTRKKIDFLHEVIKALSLAHVTVCNLDWRTFLRKTDYPIEIFCTRASLPMPELMRIFKPSSSYKASTLIYWASQQWHAEKEAQPFLKKEESYTLHHTQRRLIFFALPESISHTQ